MEELVEHKNKEQHHLLVAQYRVLNHMGLGFTEIRIPKKGTQIFTEGIIEFTEKVTPLLGEDVYVGINPRETKSGKAKDISYISCLVFDFDPIRSTETPSTEAQWKEAVSEANKMAGDVSGSIVVSSGSGAHVYIPITPVRISESVGVVDKLSVYYRRIQKRYSTDTIKVDSIGDLPRIIRVWGSHNDKSNRVCEPLDSLVLSNDIKRISLDSLLEGISVTPETNKVLSSPIKGSIPNGFRNQALTSLAGTMRRRGFSEESLLAALLEENRTKCNPPLTENEVRIIAHSVARYEPTPKPLSEGVKTMDDDYFKSLEDRKPGAMIGFPKLDAMMAGLKPGRLYIVAARPTEGKTTFLSQIARNTAKSGLRTLIFPTEVGANSIYDKLVSAHTGINLRKFQFGNFTEEERNRISNSRDLASRLPIFVAEDFSLRVGKIESVIKEIMPDVVIIDFLQSMKFDEGTPAELGQAVVTIKSLAGKYKIPIILASQLSRSAEGNKASLSQLKGSGVIEEQGDDVIYINTTDKLVYPRKVLINIMKSKYGENGIVKMDFYASTCEFKEST